MKHLTVEDIINYVSFKTMNDTDLMHAANVVSHIRKCKDCLEKVKAFQLVYDKLAESGRSAELSAMTAEIINDSHRENHTDIGR